MTTSKVSKEIADITECSICTESFREPKVLPCIHTFCLQCLETYGKDKKPGDKADCPICRSVFVIPAGGFKDLHNNFFMNQLLQLKKLSCNDATEQVVNCDVCSIISEVSTAVAFCIECHQNMCELCDKKHKVPACSKTHRVVSLTNKPSAQELIKMAPSFCEHHPTDEIKFYCYDCKITACVVCYVSNKHNKHECCDVKISAEKFREQLKDDIDKVEACAKQSKDELEKLEMLQSSFISKVGATEREISQRYDQLRLLIDEHQKQLIQTLTLFKKNHMKELETRKDELERQSVIMESFRRYGVEMVDKGTSCDISRAANDLHVRADELVRSLKEYTSIPVPKADARFTASVVDTELIKNWIGDLSLTSASKASTIRYLQYLNIKYY